MINILIDKSGKTSKENIFLGNQHENLDETLHFSFPKEYDNFYKYITYSYTNNGCRITGISPLVDDNFIITSKITKCAGVWELNLICKISPVNLDDKVIDLTENNTTKEHIFISNTISACVSGNSIDVEAFNNVAIDENIASLYDSILALKNRVEENDKTISQLSQSIHINDSSFTDVEAFKNSLQGIYLYYELAEPIVTDISDIIGDTFQEPFKVEVNGSLTFKNSNGDDYQLAVPNKEQYTIKLNEVTS